MTIPAEDSGLGQAIVDLRVPNPVSFIVQKLLIRADRDRRKRAQDVLYIYDAMVIFGGTIEDELAPIWKSLEPTLSEKQRKSVRAGVEELFTAVNGTIREAAAIPTDRRLDPEDILRLCQNAFEELFGEAFNTKE